jgi:Cu(I)/Ag(I) efflux system periplasmic protein CusF
MKTLKTALIILTLLMSAAHAQTAAKPGMDSMTMEAPQKAAPEGAMPMADMVDGEVRKVDKAAKKITLKHGEIKNLQMAGMTMVYQVKDAAMLDKLKAGDKVRFMAEKSGGAIVVTAIEQAK